jgi:hypothetical protein
MKWDHSTVISGFVLTSAILLGTVRCERSTPVSGSGSTGTTEPARSAVSLGPSLVESAAAASSPKPALSAPPAPSSVASNETKITFDAEPAGEPSPSFASMVGDWYVAEEHGARGYRVDGAKWRSGVPSASLADQAKRLYGDRYAEFLDGVKAFAFFPFTVWNGAAPTGDMRIAVRFYPEAGRIDQAAGIAFGIAPDGSYYGARANGLEDNLLFFRVVKGRRSIIDTIRGVTTTSRAWHTLAVELRGAGLTVLLDGEKKFQRTLEAKPTGRVGLWSKADSQVLFDDFTVTPL